MNMLAVDDERLALRALEDVLRALYPHDGLCCFRSPDEAIAHARTQLIDVAFLDIELGGTSGLALAERLTAIRERTNIIFTTGYAKYALPAFGLLASGYLLKPVTTEAVAKEMANLRYPPTFAQKAIRVQTFGHFEVFVGAEPLLFSRAKAKELLAYLIDRKGAAITRKEMGAVLWADRSYTRSVQTHLQIVITDMLATLEAAGIADIILHKRGSYAVDAARISCDYYHVSRGDPQALQAYFGEYMAHYAWAEGTQRLLNERLRLLGK